MTSRSSKSIVVDAAKKPAGCSMGKIYRFIEPAILLSLAEGGDTHGYELLERLGECALTAAIIDKAALYRTLRALEANGHVISHWTKGECAPARRVYQITRQGKTHLREWAALIADMREAMNQFLVKEGRANPR